MAREQPKNEKPQLEPLIGNVQTAEMATLTGTYASNGHVPAAAPPPTPRPPPTKR
jgi:hypothetical protein